MSPAQLASIVKALARKSTVASIVTRTGMTRQTIYRALRALERERAARIAEWNEDETGRAVEPVWALGSKPSVPKRRLTAAQKQKAYRSRKAIEMNEAEQKAVVR